jgi:hypothetical protein
LQYRRLAVKERWGKRNSSSDGEMLAALQEK